MTRTLSYGAFALLVGLLGSLVRSVGAEPIIEKGPYLQKADTNAITVCWVTNVDERSVVEYGTTSRLGTTAAEDAREREVWDIGGDRQLVAIHQVRLTGLQTDTRYYYRVRTGDVMSEISTFHTVVRPGEDFTFVVFGDTRPTDNHRAVISRVMSLTAEPKFVLHSGDLISNGQRWPDWQGFFDVEAPMLAKTPFYPCLGNHEHDADNYFSLFDLPDNERWYSYTYGDVHVIALDSNGPYRDNSAQRGWLVQDLKQHWDSPYTVVFFHHPPFSCTNDIGRRLGGASLQDSWHPIFEAYGVTAVFNGHDHNYQHNVVDGVHYLVSGGGGASIYPVRPRSFTVNTLPIYHIIEAKIGREAATFDVISAHAGRIVETFAVPRRNTAPVEAPE